MSANIVLHTVKIKLYSYSAVHTSLKSSIQRYTKSIMKSSVLQTCPRFSQEISGIAAMGLFSSPDANPHSVKALKVLNYK